MATDRDVLTWQLYYDDVRRDFKELHAQYPYSSYRVPLRPLPGIVTIRVVAASAALLQEVRGVEADFLGEYSKELFVDVPLDYKRFGCRVFGAGWIDASRVRDQECHFYNRSSRGYELCVGVFDSFPLMENVILECVRTADHMLVAYERLMRGESSSLELLAYSHGEKGRREFQQDEGRYVTRESW
jgi:hypothetical protein